MILPERKQSAVAENEVDDDTFLLFNSCSKHKTLAVLPTGYYLSPSVIKNPSCCLDWREPCSKKWTSDTGQKNVKEGVNKGLEVQLCVP
jgi:hypothetical protein